MSARDYIAGYMDPDKFIAYCKECPRYGHTWVCPPYSFSPLEKIVRYKYAYLIGTKVNLNDALRHSPRDAEDQHRISYQVMEEVRKELDPRLLEVERAGPNNLAFFGGSCFFCSGKGCTRPNGLPCRHPDRARSSLEAYGFDIARTAAEILGVELRWSERLVLPEYFFYVSAIFSTGEISEEKLALLNAQQAA